MLKPPESTKNSEGGTQMWQREQGGGLGDGSRGAALRARGASLITPPPRGGRGVGRGGRPADPAQTAPRPRLRHAATR